MGHGFHGYVTNNQELSTPSDISPVSHDVILDDWGLKKENSTFQAWVHSMTLQKKIWLWIDGVRYTILLFNIAMEAMAHL